MEVDSGSGECDQENSRKRTAEQRKLAYRLLLDRVEEIQESEELGLQTVKSIGEIFKEANTLEEECGIDKRVEHADETLLDSFVLSSASSILVKCIEAVDVFSYTYDPADFAQRILNDLKSEDDEEGADPANLLKLLDDARCIIPEIPEFSYVYGAYDLNKVPQPKVRKEKNKAVREKLQKKQPEKVREVDKEEASIDEIVRVFHGVLLDEFANNNEEPIKYYDYVIDTESFATTVENAFYTSFLIRDGKAQLDLNNQNQPLIKPMKKRDLKQMRDAGGGNTQVITSLSIEEWQKFKTEGLLQKYRKTHNMETGTRRIN